jgi:hypothetical protein
VDKTVDKIVASVEVNTVDLSSVVVGKLEWNVEACVDCFVVAIISWPNVVSVDRSVVLKGDKVDIESGGIELWSVWSVLIPNVVGGVSWFVVVTVVTTVCCSVVDSIWEVQSVVGSGLIVVLIFNVVL